MKINLTKKQFEVLMKAISAGSSVYGILGDSVSEEYKEESNEIEELRTYFLGLAKDFGMAEMTEEFMGDLIMSDEFSEKYHEVIEEYNDETFWHDLEVRLGKRDFERTITDAEIKELEKDGWYPKRIHKIYKEWRKEFEKNGIERLEIVEK